jgi:MFS family permease
MLALLCTLAMITYLDRAMYGSAKGDMMASVGRPVEDFFIVLVAFQLAYALFEVPTGWLGDRFGPRSTLLRLVIWWSAFVALTPLIGLIFPASANLFGVTFAVAFLVMIAAEFMFGMGEAGAFPNISKAAYNWFPATQRGFAKGAVWMSARFAGGFTPLIWVLLTSYGGLTWRQALWVFSAIAAVWCVIFWTWFRNLPHEHQTVNESERELIEAGKGSDTRAKSVPWGKLLASRNLWAICLMYTVTNFNWYFLMYYLPGALRGEYTKSREGQPAMPDADLLIPALLGGAPLLVGMLGCYLGGVLSDRHIRRTGDRRWGRRVYGMLGYGLAATAYAAAALSVGGNFWVLATCLILVGFCNDLIMGPAWATTQDVGQRYSAIVGGTMNMVGNLGATLGNLITGLILKYVTGSDGFVVCFTMYAVVYGLGVGSWLLIDPAKPVVPEGQDAAGSNA